MVAMEKTVGRSAAYGQACLSCFKTKCKCIPRLEGNGCERCHRLKRPCHPADVLRRRSDKKQNSSDDRIAKLEGTLSQLVSLLQAGNVNVDIIGNMGNMSNAHGDRVDVRPQQQQQQSPPQHHQRHQQHQQQEQQPMLDLETADHHPATLMHTPPVIPYQDVLVEGTEGSGTAEDSGAAFINEADDDIDAVGASASWWATDNANEFSANALAKTPPSTAFGAFISPSSASISLDTFRSRMLHHFPFVLLSAHLTAEQLWLDRPFLFRAIVCVTSPSAEDKRARSLELKRVLYETTFLQRSPQQKQQQPQQQTVDLLLGLLVYVAWGWEHLLSRRSLSRLMVVAIWLVEELRFLDQAVPEITRIIRRLGPNNSFDDVYGSTAATPATMLSMTGVGVTDTQLYLERQQAILGCFVLGSAVSTYFSQIDAPRWMPQMDEGLAAIIASGNSAGAECPSDAALAIQVRLQLLAMKAAQVRERAQLPDHPPPEILPPEALLYIKTLMGQLQELRASVPPAFQQHFVILAQTYYTEMCIIETIHIQEPACGPQAKPTLPTCGPTRLSCLWHSALAIKSCTSTFLTLSPSGLVGVSFIQWAQLARSVATLHQLNALHEPGWDTATLRSLVDLSVLLSCMADKLDLAATEAGQQPVSANGVFTQLTHGLRIFQSAYYDRGLLTQQQEAQRATEAGDRAGTRADTATVTATVAASATEANTDALAYGQQAEYLMSPTLWLDQFFVDYEDQTMPTL